MVFALLTLSMLAAFCITGAKKHSMGRWAIGFGILAALSWLIIILMR